MTYDIIRGDALHLPLANGSVDLIVTSPPYFGLRSYQDGCPTCADSVRAGMRGYMERYCPGCLAVGTVNVCPKCGLTTLRTDATKAANKAAAGCPDCNGTGKGHYDGQLGSEATPAEFVDALLAATAEMVRVLKPSGSIFVNLGDKYATAQGPRGERGLHANVVGVTRTFNGHGVREKSLYGIPWRYALRCIDDLGLILRAEIIWSKPNGLPESVTDRVRRSHEQWFHFTVRPRYYSAVDEVRETYAPETAARYAAGYKVLGNELARQTTGYTAADGGPATTNPLGKLPGSVWTVPTQPLSVPAHLGVDHFAAFPMEWPRRIIRGWSPPGVCTGCGEGLTPVTERTSDGRGRETTAAKDPSWQAINRADWQEGVSRTITGYRCACAGPRDVVAGAAVADIGPHALTPAVVLDPFGGTGTTALVAHALGRHGISVDMSADYCRLAEWRCNDRGQLAAALEVDKPAPVPEGQLDMFGEEIQPSSTQRTTSVSLLGNRTCDACGYRSQYARKPSCDRCGAPRASGGVA